MTTENRQSLGKSGLEVPRMGLGAMIWGQPKGFARWTPAQRAYGPSDGREEEERAFAAALAGGVDLIDTAAMYANGASERRVGELARGREMLIATKFPRTMSARAKDLPRALDESLANLGRSSIDLYQHHYPSGRVQIAELMDGMAEALKAGKIKAIGVSNYSAEQMRSAHAALARHGIALASNQVMYSLAHRAPEVDGVMEACRELGVTLIAYSPLGMGALTGKYSAKVKASGFRRLLPDFGRKNMDALQPVLGLLRKYGERYSKTPSQVALRWLIENPVVLPIPGAKNARQARENAGALSFSLTSDEVQALDEVSVAFKRPGR